MVNQISKTTKFDRELSNAFDSAMVAIEKLMTQLQRNGHLPDSNKIKLHYYAIDQIRDRLQAFS